MSNYYNQPSTYPGGPAMPQAQYGGGGGASSPYSSSASSGSHASSYYDGHPGNTSVSQHRGNGQSNVPGQQPQDGERGLGTMALGAVGGIAANKMGGGHQGNMSSAAGGAFLAQGAKWAYEAFVKKDGGKHHGHHGGGHHGPPSKNPLQSMFGSKREL